MLPAGKQGALNISFVSGRLSHIVSRCRHRRLVRMVQRTNGRAGHGQTGLRQLSLRHRRKLALLHVLWRSAEAEVGPGNTSQVDTGIRFQELAICDAQASAA